MCCVGVEESLGVLCVCVCVLRLGSVGVVCVVFKFEFCGERKCVCHSYAVF